MRYISGILIALGLVVLMIILIVKAFSGGGGGAPAPQQIDLNSYASTSAVMQLTIDGPVNADKDHSKVRITVGRDETVLDIIKGYEDNAVSTKSFSSNQAAYSQFLHALNVAGFTKGNTDPNVRDERGYCPVGERFIFEAISGGSSVMRWWKTSCGEGNFRGRADVIRNLFKAQVPSYNLLTLKTQLY
jgi:hypothetical protein